MRAGGAGGRPHRPHAPHALHAFLGVPPTVGEEFGLEDVPAFSTRMALFQAACGKPDHVVYQTLAWVNDQRSRLECRICDGKGSSLERHVYAMLADMRVGRIAVETNVLLTVLRHPFDIWLVDQGRALIEVDGSQHERTSMHGQDVEGSVARDLLIDGAVVDAGWQLLRLAVRRQITPDWERGVRAAVTALIQRSRQQPKTGDVAIYPEAALQRRLQRGRPRRA